jgi:hypothetical protein
MFDPVKYRCDGGRISGELLYPVHEVLADRSNKVSKAAAGGVQSRAGVHQLVILPFEMRPLYSGVCSSTIIEDA